MRTQQRQRVITVALNKTITAQKSPISRNQQKLTPKVTPMSLKFFREGQCHKMSSNQIGQRKQTGRKETYNRGYREEIEARLRDWRGDNKQTSQERREE